MPRKHLLSAAVLLSVVLAACERAEDAPPADATDQPAAAQTSNEPPAELRSAAERFVDAWNGEDAAALAAMFTEDARVVDDDTATYVGREQIRAQWLEPALPVLSNLEVEDERWEAAGQDFRTTGRYSYTATTPQGDVTVRGRYEDTWTRGADGQWRISSMRTNNDPAPATTGS